MDFYRCLEVWISHQPNVRGLVSQFHGSMVSVSQTLNSMGQRIGYTIIRFHRREIYTFLTGCLNEVALLKVDFFVSWVSKESYSNFGSKVAEAERHLLKMNLGIYKILI